MDSGQLAYRSIESTNAHVPYCAKLKDGTGFADAIKIMELQPFQQQDEATYCQMAWDFHSGPASAATPSMDAFKRTFAHVVKATDAWGWLILDDSEIAGYVLCSQMYSTEVGGYQIWIEDISISDAFQGRGLGTKVMQALFEHFKDARRIRLEITPENTGAAKLYERLGFSALPYQQMKIDRT